MCLKRYFFLLAATLGTIGILLGTGKAFQKTAKPVDTWVVRSETVSDTLMCTGTVERANEKKLTAPQNAVIVDMLVNQGSEVEKGETVCTLRVFASDSDSKVSQETYQQLWEEYQQTGVVPEEAQGLLAAASQIQSSNYKDTEEEGELISITSPISGTVTSLSPIAGDVVSIGDELMTISDPKKLQVRLAVNEGNIYKIQVGQEASITGSGFPEETFEGEVLSISDEATRQASTSGSETTVEVMLKVLNPTKAIKPGYTVKASVTTEELPDTLLIPYEAVSADEDGQEWIYLVQNHRAVKMKVTAKQEFAEGFTIEEKIDEGAQVILTPEQVAEGDYVSCAAKEALSGD